MAVFQDPVTGTEVSIHLRADPLMSVVNPGHEEGHAQALARMLGCILAGISSLPEEANCALHHAFLRSLYNFSEEAVRLIEQIMRAPDPRAEALKILKELAEDSPDSDGIQLDMSVWERELGKKDRPPDQPA